MFNQRERIAAFSFQEAYIFFCNFSPVYGVYCVDCEKMTVYLATCAADAKKFFEGDI